MQRGSDLIWVVLVLGWWCERKWWIGIGIGCFNDVAWYKTVLIWFVWYWFGIGCFQLRGMIQSGIGLVYVVLIWYWMFQLSGMIWYWMFQRRVWHFFHFFHFFWKKMWKQIFLILFIVSSSLAIQFSLKPNSEKCLKYDFNQDDIVSGFVEVQPDPSRQLSFKVLFCFGTIWNNWIFGEIF